MLALRVLLAVPGWAGDDSLNRLQTRHAELGETARIRLGELRSMREAFPSASDPDLALAQWAAKLDEADSFSKLENEIRGEHRQMIKTLTSAAISRAISGVAHKTYKPDMGSARIFVDEGAAEEMKVRSYDLGAKIHREAMAFQAASKARQDQKRSRKYALWGAGGGVVFLVLVVLIIAPWGPPGDLPAPPASAPAGDALALLAGNFQVGPLIGRGAMGEVFSAVDKTLNRRVALKRMRPELLAEPKDRERFLAEARLVAGLKHPNIVSIHSVAQEAGETYLVFEFVEGHTLEETLRARGRLPWPEALAFLRGICSALEFAHSKGVVHRDLKPSNVMVTPDASVKVMDFGIAHQARVSASRMTRGASMGTPPYMSPEQELGGVSAGVDVYAAAVCFYEMLTGRLPFSGPNFLAQKREEVYAPASTLAPGLPPGADAFFKAALAPQPSSRPKNAGTLYAAAAELKA
ncbi:MAG: serine/threonine protein kinase [Elusimicrobia bacterium]|nr:serine/threonine protein kinase [Elusimicrobiota bacterium]